MVVQSAEPEDRQSGVGLADDAADGRNRLLRGAANLDIKGRASVFAFEHREEGLLGIVAKAAIIEAGADADDCDVGPDVWTGAQADADADGITTGQIALNECLIDDGGAVTGFAGWAGIASIEISAGKDANAEGREKTGTRR